MKTGANRVPICTDKGAKQASLAPLTLGAHATRLDLTPHPSPLTRLAASEVVQMLFVRQETGAGTGIGTL